MSEENTAVHKGTSTGSDTCSHFQHYCTNYGKWICVTILLL